MLLAGLSLPRCANIVMAEILERHEKVQSFVNLNLDGMHALFAGSGHENCLCGAACVQMCKLDANERVVCQIASIEERSSTRATRG